MDYESKKILTPQSLKRHESGVLFGRWGLYLTIAAVPFCFFCPILCPVIIFTGLTLAIVGLFSSRFQSRAGLVALIIDAVLIVLFIVVAILDKQYAAPAFPLLPPGFPPVVAYSMPRVDPEIYSSVDLKGVYRHGKLSGLSVTRITENTHLDRDYGLRVGDEIVPFNGESFADKPERVVRAEILASTPSNHVLAIIRGGKAWYISPGGAAHDVPAGIITTQP